MEAIQELILETLQAKGSIDDTRHLVVPGKDTQAVSQDDQLAILGALKSLESREVSFVLLHSLLRL